MNPEHEKYLISNYAKPALEIIKGEGSYLWDSSGTKFLDFTSGIAVTNIGHGHKHWIEKVTKQAKELTHCSNLFSIPEQVKLAKRLVDKVGPGKMLFCNSGAEANEAMIKFSRLVGKKNAKEKTTLLVAENGFHGRTIGALSATSSPKYREGFEPLLDGFSFAPLNDLKSFENLVNEQTVGVMLESIQGEGGIRVAEDKFLQGLEKLCKDQNLLFLLDEVQTGIGRTGEFLGFQKSGVRPDAVAIAKGLGGGFPIGAIWISEKWSDIFQPGSHGTTFGGSPLACSAANSVLDVLEQENLILGAREKGQFLKAGLEKLKVQYPDLVNVVRGRGLMLALVLNESPTRLIELLRQSQLLVVGAAENSIRYLPPLTVTKNELQEGLEITGNALSLIQKDQRK
ncbi:MAG: aspartate aminotransferase family protein [Opitutae bacterium]|nr:aspartate aminotransferase family protein [Opitutae bacterium]